MQTSIKKKRTVPQCISPGSRIFLPKVYYETHVELNRQIAFLVFLACSQQHFEGIIYFVSLFGTGDANLKKSQAIVLPK